jgi:glycosyltransferase involved in cell wall biosynthesis
MQIAGHPRISIIVASHRPSYIGECVTGLLGQQCEEIPFELIVVADYAIDILRLKFPSVRWIYHNDLSIPAKRNRGIAAAGSAVCAFLDDDCRPAADWLAQGISFLDANPDIAGVEGTTLIAVQGAPDGALREFKRLEKPGYRTNNIFYRKAALESVGCFDERFTVQREDADLAYSLLEAGHAIGFSDAIRVRHAFRPGERWDLLKNCVHRRFDPLLYKKHTRLYRRHVGSPVPPVIAAMLAGHLFFCAVLAAAPPWIWAGALIDGVLIFAAAIRRSGWRSLRADRIITDMAALIVSPFALWSALLWGSIRFRKALLW